VNHYTIRSFFFFGGGDRSPHTDHTHTHETPSRNITHALNNFRYQLVQGQGDMTHLEPQLNVKTSTLVQLTLDLLIYGCFLKEVKLSS
jgi:hypothetical protein